MTPDIPKDQLERIRPIVDPLLAEIRRIAQQLSSQSEPAVDYQVDEERAQ